MTNDEQKDMEISATLNALAAQRNNALDALASSNARVTSLDAKLTEAVREIEELKKQINELKSASL